jgi:hypothetical protein
MRIGPVAGSIQYVKSKGENRTDGYGAGGQKGCSKVRTSEHFFREFDVETLVMFLFWL